MQAPRSYNSPVFDIEGPDFPITLYDRPGLAMSNLILRGDVDAMTRSLFSPKSLTPQEMETFTKRLLGKKSNPLAKTLLDIATNPVVIAGLVAGYLIWPVGTTRPLFELAKGLKAVPASGAVGSWVGSAFSGLRNVPKLYDALSDYLKTSLDFVQKWGEELTKVAGGTLPDAKTSRAIMYMAQGWNKADNELLKMYPELAKKIGNGPLAPGLQGKLTQDQLSFVGKMRKWLDGVWDDVVGPGGFEQFKTQMEMKGIDVGGYRQNYWPHRVQKSELERTILRRYFTRRRYGKGVQELIDSSLKKRGLGIPDLAQLAEDEAAGLVRPGLTQALKEVVEERVTGFAQQLRPLVEQAEMIGDPDRAMKTLTEGLKPLLKKGTGISSRTTASMIDETATTLADAILQFHGQPDKVAGAVDDIARLVASPSQYSLDPWKSIETYMGGLGTTYAWHSAGHGDRIRQIWGAAKASPQRYGLRNWQFSYMDDELLPMVQGFKPLSVHNRNVAWGEYKDGLVRWLESHPMAAGGIPDKSRRWLISKIDRFGAESSETIGNLITQSFHLSTLGAPNVAPPSKNLLQNFITTANMPGIGLQGLYRGLRTALPKLIAYTDDVLRGAERTTAFKKHFPEYVKALGAEDDVLNAMLRGGVEYEGTAAATATGEMARGALRKAERLMLTPFSASELFNRTVGFYSGYEQALRHGDTIKAALKVGLDQFGAAEAVGKMVVEASHFRGGPLGIPRGTLSWWGPWRQFTHFPLRYADFLKQSVRWGPDAARMDFGTIGRTAAMSAGIYEAGRNLLGVDLSGGLLTGALPLPQYEQAPFYPFPMVPPLMSVIGSGVQAIHKGELEPLTNAAAMLVPGGLGIKRLNRTLGPKYADYQNRTPDGRVPVYNKDQALIGAFTPWQLSLRAMGLAPVTAQGEQAAAEWLLAQRDKIRTYRRKWLEALQGNDVGKADQINREFQEAYPEFGPMQVKKSDISAMRNRREISRLQRILKGFPRAYRPLFESAVGEAQLRDFAANLPAMELSGAFGQGL